MSLVTSSHVRVRGKEEVDTAVAIKSTRMTTTANNVTKSWSIKWHLRCRSVFVCQYGALDERI